MVARVRAREKVGVGFGKEKSKTNIRLLLTAVVCHCPFSDDKIASNNGTFLIKIKAKKREFRCANASLLIGRGQEIKSEVDSAKRLWDAGTDTPRVIEPECSAWVKM